MKKYARNSGYELSYDEAAKERMHWEEEAFRTTLKVVDAIIESTESQIVLRPHPNENPYVWEDIFRDNPRISIVKYGDSLPFIFASKHVIHSGSTVGLESLLCGISTISFQNLIRNDAVPMTANQFSRNVNSIDELKTFLRSNSLFRPESTFYEIAQRKLTKFNDATVLDEISEIIHDTKFDKRIAIQLDKLSNSDRVKKSRLYQRLVYGKSSYLEIHRNKRPIISIDKISKDANKLLEQFRYDYEVQIKELGESTFSIRRIGNDEWF